MKELQKLFRNKKQNIKKQDKSIIESTRSSILEKKIYLTEHEFWKLQNRIFLIHDRGWVILSIGVSSYSFF